MLTTKKLLKTEDIGYCDVYDICMNIGAEHFPEGEPNFIVEGTVVHNSHAGGFVVSSDNAYENIPVVKAGKGDVTGWQESGAVKELEALGWIKVDILGLACVEQIRLCVEEVNKKYPGEIKGDPYLLPTDDPKVYDFINTLELENVFQMESKVFKEAVRKIKPRSLQDISNISTLVRPGAAEVDDYVKMHNVKRVEPKCLHYVYDHTRGLMIYQEQLMQVLMVLGGFSIFDADKVRRLVRKIGKAKTSDENREAMLKESEKYHTKYLKTATQKITEEDGWTEKDAKEYADAQWKQIMLQAKYAFNLPHCFFEDELVTLSSGKKKRVKYLKPGDKLTGLIDNKIEVVTVRQNHDNGIQEIYEIVTNKNVKIKCTLNHKFMTEKGLKTVEEIFLEDLNILEKSDFE